MGHYIYTHTHTRVCVCVSLERTCKNIPSHSLVVLSPSVAALCHIFIASINTGERFSAYGLMHGKMFRDVLQKFQVPQLPCGHAFHFECAIFLAKWYKVVLN